MDENQKLVVEQAQELATDKICQWLKENHKTRETESFEKAFGFNKETWGKYDYNIWDNKILPYIKDRIIKWGDNIGGIDFINVVVKQVREWIAFECTGCPEYGGSDWARLFEEEEFEHYFEKLMGLKNEMKRQTQSTAPQPAAPESNPMEAAPIISPEQAEAVKQLKQRYDSFIPDIDKFPKNLHLMKPKMARAIYNHYLKGKGYPLPDFVVLCLKIEPRLKGEKGWNYNNIKGIVLHKEESKELCNSWLQP